MTIVNAINGLSENFNVLTATGNSIVTSIFYNDFNSLSSAFTSLYTNFDATVLPIAAFSIQTIFALISVFVPTSIFLMAGLKYLDLPYKEWIKFIWKFILIIFALIVIITFLLSLLV